MPMLNLKKLGVESRLLRNCVELSLLVHRIRIGFNRATGCLKCLSFKTFGGQ